MNIIPKKTSYKVGHILVLVAIIAIGFLIISPTKLCGWIAFISGLGAFLSYAYGSIKFTTPGTRTSRTHGVHGGSNGFSLIEILLLVAVVCVLVLAIVIGSIRKDSGTTNESSAIAWLKKIHIAQAEFQDLKVVDLNQDGTGEFGFLGELMGKSSVRVDMKGGVGSKFATNPPLSIEFGEVDKSCVTSSGYCFRIFLPSATDESWVTEAPKGGAKEISISSNAAWVAYAWPEKYGETGQQAFFIDTSGVVHVTNNETQMYQGSTSGPLWDAALDSGDVRHSRGNTKSDGQSWSPIK